MRAREVHPQVWVAVGAETVDEPVTPADRLAARGTPPWRTRQLLGGRALLRALLARVAPAAADAPLVAAGNGKPVLAGWPRLGVNLSHDGGHVAVCVATDRRVGVDVQTPPEPVSEPLLRRCAARHLTGLARLPERQRARAFAEIWTVQEACVKVDGAGIGGLPWTIDVPPDADTGRWHGRRWHKVRDLADVPVACAWDEERR
ncbi:4'-phosphopantetheinyl transferase superfamily protein [Micromonospora sp. WMMD882]|uniref:4'-phosphopantetheinyl transferase family protein n=1 Tax=Micromonospora sp. WMMD882 TaxID=3015151 RepID=UPI00248C1686|nr:4'-phosphopantetheinyl transferase superfamily protein [Micromonospora sp. WMMD882]WBB78724.1 4'-phosphopantetheinyl transferase superfamily protein [Micromonospora sp. WMMD882]